MTRRFLDNLRTQINNTIVTAGATTAVEMLPLLIDTIDSSIQDESIVSSTAPSLGTMSTTDFTPLTTIFHEQRGGDGDFLKPDFTIGQIQTSITPGFTYNVVGLLKFTDLGNNTFIDFTILQNGIPVGSEADETGDGNNKPVNISVFANINSAGADDVFTLGMRTPQGIIAVDILQAALSVIITPTNNP